MGSQTNLDRHVLHSNPTLATPYSEPTQRHHRTSIHCLDQNIPVEEIRLQQTNGEYELSYLQIIFKSCYSFRFSDFNRISIHSICIHYANILNHALSILYSPKAFEIVTLNYDIIDKSLEKYTLHQLILIAHVKNALN